MKIRFLYALLCLNLVFLSFSCWDDPVSSDDASDSVTILDLEPVQDSLGTPFVDTLINSFVAGSQLKLYAKTSDILLLRSIEACYFKHSDSTTSKKIKISTDTITDTIICIGEIDLNLTGKISLIYSATPLDTLNKVISDTVEVTISGLAPTISISNTLNPTDTAFTLKELSTLSLTFIATGNYPSSTPYFTSISNLPLGASFDSSTGIFSYTPDTNVAGTIIPTITVTAYDNSTPPVPTSYSIYLSVEDSVIIIDNQPPVITLVGSNPDTIALGTTTYIDSGATAFDSVDGLISFDNFIVTGTIKTDSLGIQTLIYNVSDNAGNAAIPVTRTVFVRDTANPDVSAPVITLLGNNPDTVYFGIDEYVDLGATAYDSVDGLIAFDKFIVSGIIKKDSLGAQTLTYNVSDNAGNSATTLIRTVIVIDTTAPVIILAGDNPQSIIVGTGDYTDPGCYATDNADGTIPIENFVITGTVDKSTVGSYTLTYNVSDKSGNAATAVQRVVNVEDIPDTEPPVITINPDAVSGLEQKYDTVFVAASYTVPPAIANDNKDGLIPNESITKNPTTISTTSIGVFKVTYSASDVAGNIGYDTLTIHVIEDVNDTIVPVTLNAATSLTYKSAALSWSKSTDDKFASYRLCYSSTAGVLESAIDYFDFNSIATLNTTLNNLADGTTYYAKVFVYDTDNEVAGSNEISFTTEALTTPVITITAPTLNASNEGPMSAAASTVKFTVSSPAIQPDLQVSASFNTNSISPTFNVANNEWEFNINSASPNIKAFNDVEISVNDSKQTVKKAFKVFYKPALVVSAAPTVTDTSNRSLSISWTSPQYCTNHILYRSTTGEGNSFVQVFNSTLQAHLDDSLEIGTNYWYATRSYYAETQGSLTVSDTTELSQTVNIATLKWLRREFTVENPMDIIYNGDGYTILAKEVMCVSRSGDVLWSEEIKMENDPMLKPHSIVKTDDNGYLITGAYRTHGEDLIFVMKVDSMGQKVWERKHEGIAGHSIIKAPDGGFIITGKDYSSGSYQLILLKVDDNGIYDWSKTFDHPSGSIGEKILLSSQNDSYFVAGHLGEQAYFAKFNLAGEIIFQDTTRHSNVESAIANSIIEISDGFILCGVQTYPASSPLGNRALLLKYDISNMNKSINTSIYTDIAIDVLQTEDKGYLFTGDETYSLFKTNYAGTNDFHKIYPNFKSQKVLKGENGSYTILGQDPITYRTILICTDENLNIEE